MNPISCLILIIFEEEELVDIDEVKQNIAAIEAELAQVQAQMAKYLEELGL